MIIIQTTHLIYRINFLEVNLPSYSKSYYPSCLNTKSSQHSSLGEHFYPNLSSIQPHFFYMPDFFPTNQLYTSASKKTRSETLVYT